MCFLDQNSELRKILFVINANYSVTKTKFSDERKKIIENVEFNGFSLDEVFLGGKHRISILFFEFKMNILAKQFYCFANEISKKWKLIKILCHTKVKMVRSQRSTQLTILRP